MTSARQLPEGYHGERDSRVSSSSGTSCRPCHPQVIVNRALLVAGALALVLVLWCTAGSVLVAALDRVTTAEVTSLPLQPLAAVPNTLVIGSRGWPLHDVIRLTTDAKGQVSAERGGVTVALGAATRTTQGSGGPHHEFDAEPGDQLTFVTSRSRMSWPTPMKAWLVIGAPRSWARHVYHRLRWVKACGASLELEWRDEDHYHPGASWSEAYLDFAPRATLHACTETRG